ncbi:MAG: hypothetical protein LBU89_06140, partial [Fibromonadaceae bacterium]|nr:hypothetical protein [Fibromonadaceae bacterium]
MSDSSLFNLSVDGFSGRPAVLSFNLQEGLYGDDLLTVSLLSRTAFPNTLAGKELSFSFEFEGRKEFFNGVATNCSTERTAAEAFTATLKAKTHQHLLDKETKSTVYCRSDV